MSSPSTSSTPAAPYPASRITTEPLTHSGRALAALERAPALAHAVLASPLPRRAITRRAARCAASAFPRTALPQHLQSPAPRAPAAAAGLAPVLLAPPPLLCHPQLPASPIRLAMLARAA
nr:predicted GPI-anchored protein 58 [Aegilops tauschii subsp. strangulata]